MIEPASHLTDDEITALQSADLHGKTAYLIRGVSQGYFSVARISGGAKIQGSDYVYIPPTDELIRADVLRWVTQRRKAAAKEAAAAKKAKRGQQMQPELL